MKVLWVVAHPEQRSLNSALREEGVHALTEAGHSVQVSDLYAMKWKAVVDRDDFTDGLDERFVVPNALVAAYNAGTAAPDILAEQEKIAWADTLVVQFPLWWQGMPAILKGWFDRVFAMGFVMDTRPHPGATPRYGQGELEGKRALAVVTTGHGAESYGPRGINGPIDQILFPLLHGTLWYAGMSVLPPVVVHRAGWMPEEKYPAAAALVRERVLAIEETAPLPFRYQNHGDYDDDLVLRPEIDADAGGLGVHYLG
ncbi:NAD(P)H-dependent oxidoreductase [Amycolatopsis sp. cmx-11-12]|uniref:NAD(P)H-dependent oxidoreductase n=1 Tax=Amycolatopsis sp. cmx-11-12 TaxID=2785795 RepID=UPI003917CA12